MITFVKEDQPVANKARNTISDGSERVGSVSKSEEETFPKCYSNNIETMHSSVVSEKQIDSDVPWETRCDEAHERKPKYLHLQEQCKAKG